MSLTSGLHLIRSYKIEDIQLINISMNCKTFCRNLVLKYYPINLIQYKTTIACYENLINLEKTWNLAFRRFNFHFLRQIVLYSRCNA